MDEILEEDPTGQTEIGQMIEELKKIKIASL
jgi:hypothetical protein